MQVAHNAAAAASFDNRPPSSFTSSAPLQHSPPLYGGSQQVPHASMSQQSQYRGFSDVNGVPQSSFESRPQIYTAVYSGVSVYEMEVNRVIVMKRRSDAWLNATQVLKVAGVDKGKRTKVLEKEILSGEHEKVQGGYGKYQGTWVNYNRGRQFCREYGVEDMLRPLLDYDTNADGSGGQGQGIDTPTKEQAMAANRKRLYSSNVDGRGTVQNANGTFFSNISSTASNAIAAMNKVARLNSPAPRPGSSQRRPQSSARPSLAPMNSQDSFRGGSQQSVQSERSFGVNGHADSSYVSQSGPYADYSGMPPPDSQEPPRKRMRPSSQQEEPLLLTRGNSDASMRDGSPTEAADSFVYHQSVQASQMDGEAPMALAPLPDPTEKVAEEKQSLLLDLFADLSRTDFSDHPAILHLSGADLDLPLDQSANTAIHWAATLARVSLMRLLISKGANIFRANAAGQTPLMSAVQVNNCLDHSCFPEVLEILAPLIEMRDLQGRTILHHIAVSCGIKGRAASSKYYLEALLEFLVRSNSANSQPSSFDGPSSQGALTAKPIGLMRFMSEMVNARDKGGNTALNLVARVGNRSIIQQLIEVQADVTIPNYKGLRPTDFGVGGDPDRSAHQSFSQADSSDKSKGPTSKVEETSKDIMPALSSFLTQTDSQFAAELRLKQDQVDRTNSTIRELSALQTLELQKLEALQQRIRLRSDRRQRILNLQRAAQDHRAHLSRPTADHAHPPLPPATDVRLGAADAGLELPAELDHTAHDTPTTPLSPAVRSRLPGSAALRARLAAYGANNATLRARAAQLRARSGALEAQYRTVVSLCTGVEERRVEATLPALVAAVESEGGEGVETGRVNEFLRNMQGVEG